MNNTNSWKDYQGIANFAIAAADALIAALDGNDRANKVASA